MCLAQNFSLSVFYILFPSFCFCLPSFFQFSFLISVVNIYFLLFIDFYCLVLVFSSAAQAQPPAGMLVSCRVCVFISHCLFWNRDLCSVCPLASLSARLCSSFVTFSLSALLPFSFLHLIRSSPNSFSYT